MLYNTFLFTPFLICVRVRRPFDIEMFVSSIGIIMAHFCWIYFAGIRSWVAVYIASFSQPTHMPLSLYFGYFYGIHSGVEVDSYDSDETEKNADVADEETGDIQLMNENTASSNKSGNDAMLASSSKRTCQVTVSNYSWLMRFITYDQSLHCEHHDFPKIPCHLLGKLRHIAPEFYGMSNNKKKSKAPVQSYQYFLSPWIKFLYSKPSAYASCTDSLE